MPHVAVYGRDRRRLPDFAIVAPTTVNGTLAE